jgi:trk system potassium uptake protein TrkH
MTPFDAINHSFSTIATGGFSTKNTSIMYYDSLSIDLILIVFMILSSIHFGVLFLIFSTLYSSTNCYKISNF